MIFHNIRPVEVNNGPIGGHFEFYQLKIFQDAFSPETLQFI